ncbi:MAG TPA: hypothetical protein VJR92_14140 [Gemmatimonadaceae bacterium]|nr:hypothetical protein [Gemmatimonadaceae bacterium]
MPAPNDLLRKNVRTFYAFLGSVALLGVGPIIAIRLIEGGTQWGRIAAVTIAMISWIPWIVVVIGMIRRGDEFALRVHLVGLAIAFFGLMTVLAALDWLARARFIATPDLAFVWPVGLLLWFIGIMSANHYYQRQS